MNEIRKYVSIDRQPTSEPSRSAYTAAAKVLVARILSVRPTGRADRSMAARVRAALGSLVMAREPRHRPGLRSILEPRPRASLVTGVRHLLHDPLEIAARAGVVAEPRPAFGQTGQELTARVLGEAVEHGCLDRERPLEAGDRRFLHDTSLCAIAHVGRGGAQSHRAYEHHDQRVGCDLVGTSHLRA